MSKLSTHVLDTSLGIPARGVAVSLEIRSEGAWVPVGAGHTDDDGRLRLVDDERPALAAGAYRLTFETAAYFARTGTPAFFPSVTIAFDVRAGDDRLHVPLLLAPYGYSTYRGS